MLVLSRKIRESVVVGCTNSFDPIVKITVLQIVGARVKLGFDVPRDIPVNRSEVWERVRDTGQPEPT